MRTLGLRSKLLLVSALLTLVAGLLGVAFFEVRLRSWLELRIQNELLHYAGMAARAVEIADRAGGEAAELDALADRLGQAAQARVTIIAADGVVLGDSRVPAARVPRMVNHGQRPEVRQALAGREGVARRLSATLGQEMLYAALAGPIRGGRGVVRVGMSLQEVDQAVLALRWLVLVVGMIGVATALLILVLSYRVMFGRLRRLVRSARALARGEGQPIELSGSDELGMLAGSVNRLAVELERTMGKLVRERNRLETVLEGMSDAILTLDYKQRVRMYNHEAQALLGLTDDALKRPLSEVVSLAPLLEMARRGAQEVTSAEFDLPGLKPRRVQARARPLRAAGETLVVLNDVTEVRRLETIRKDFVANVSHELRTPISVIQANSETLLDGAMDDPDFGRDFVEAIHRNSERLSRLITDLLDLSRIEARRYPMTIEPLSVRQAAQRVVDTMSQAVNARAMQVALEVPAGLQVLADSKALDQVLYNLFDNAIKYTSEGGHICVRAEATSGNVRIEVQDDGPGIEPRHRTRIFERFYRIDPGRSRDMGGTGLGLAIVKHLVDSMRGNIGVKPGEGGGSLFWVTLPLVGDGKAGEPARSN